VSQLIADINYRILSIYLERIGKACDYLETSADYEKRRKYVHLIKHYALLIDEELTNAYLRHQKSNAKIEND